MYVEHKQLAMKARSYSILQTDVRDECYVVLIKRYKAY
jgi:hypothetical protein